MFYLNFLGFRKSTRPNKVLSEFRIFKGYSVKKYSIYFICTLLFLKTCAQLMMFNLDSSIAVSPHTKKPLEARREVLYIIVLKSVVTTSFLSLHLSHHRVGFCAASHR